jgi:hypothetical protein
MRIRAPARLEQEPVDLEVLVEGDIGRVVNGIYRFREIAA